MRNSPKIVITGVTSFRNRGVEALVGCTIAALRERLPGATFTVLDRAPEYDGPRMAFPDVKFSPDGTFRRMQSGKIRRLVYTLLPAADAAGTLARRQIAEADAVVVTGGDLFCSEYGSYSLRNCLEPLRIARRHRVPYFFHAQSIGPFATEEHRRMFMDIARDAATLSVREQASFRYLTGELGLPQEKVPHVADPAFLLPHSQPGDFGGQLFEALRARPDRPTVGLSVSQAICGWKGEDGQRHLEIWLEIIRWLRLTLDANVILVPHVQETVDGNNDLVPATKLQRLLEWDPAVKVAAGDLSSRDFKAVLSRCDFAVVERMHAGIACLSTGVPVLTVGYSIKAEGILTDLLGAGLTRALALISIRDFLQPGRAAARVKEAWDRRAEIAAALIETLPEARARAVRAYDPIVDYLSKRAASS
jgi:colanic acid/amylovoran biosynthesis protein